SREAEFDLDNGTRQSLVLQLERGHEIEGITVASNRVVIGNVDVYVVGVSHVKSDNNGRFSVHGISDEKQLLCAAHESNASGVIDVMPSEHGAPREVLMVLRPTALSGIV